MLVITRKNGQKVMINDDIEITVVESRNGVCKLAISAPKNMKIYREEIYMQIKLANLVGQNTPTTALDELSTIVDNQKDKINPKNPEVNKTEEIVIDDFEMNKNKRIFISKKKLSNE